MVIFGGFLVKAEIQSKTLLPNQYWGLGTDLESGETLYFQISSPSVGVNIYIMDDIQMSIYQSSPQDTAWNYTYQWTSYYLLTYSFMAPDTQHYWVLIINPSDSESTYVTIDAYIVKSLTITTPTNTDTFLPVINYITWDSTGDIQYVQIELYKDGMFLKTITSWTNNDGSYGWYIYDDEYEDGDYYQIKIIDDEDSSIYDYSDYFSIETEIERITITSPTSADRFVSGDSLITWTSTGDVNYVKIDLYKDNAYLETIISSTTNDGSYIWEKETDEYEYGLNYQIKISDSDDNTVYDYSDYFTLDAVRHGYSSDPSFYMILNTTIIVVIGLVVAISVILVRRHRGRRLGELSSREDHIEKEGMNSVEKRRNIQEQKVSGKFYCSLCGEEIQNRVGDYCSKCGGSIK